MKVVLNYINNGFSLELESGTLVEIDKYTSQFNSYQELLNTPKYEEKIGQFRYDNEKYIVEEDDQVLISYIPFCLQKNELLLYKKILINSRKECFLDPIYSVNNEKLEISKMINNIKEGFKDKNKAINIYNFYNELFSNMELSLASLGFKCNKDFLYLYGLNHLLKKIINNNEAYFWMRTLDYIMNFNFTHLDNKQYIKKN